MSRSYRDKIVVVTGGGSGIGRATVLAFAERGAGVLAADIDEAAAQRTAELARAVGAQEAFARRVDVASDESMEELAAGLPGAPDIVVNNAGIGMAGGLLDTSPEAWNRILQINLNGVARGCRLFGRQMVDRGSGGHIVNLASAAAFTPNRGMAAYATTKAAVLMLSECLRAELAPHKIGVSVICPGFVNTNISKTTEYVALDAEAQERARKAATRGYELRNFPPEKVAKEIVRAVERNAAVVPVAAEAKLNRALSRLSPGAMRLMARVDPAVLERRGKR